MTQARYSAIGQHYQSAAHGRSATATLGDVMDNTLGISRSQADPDRRSYYSRGFQIDNYMVDGIPTYFESRWNLGDVLSDTALLSVSKWSVAQTG